MANLFFVFVQKDNPNLTQKNTMTFDDFIKKNHPQKPYALMDLSIILSI
ncbi:hypothetical protein [Faucicola boevrei]|nr:hypothetical protein [Moraxella boevrei]